MQNFIKDRDKLLNELWTEDLTQEKLKNLLKESSDLIMFHVVNLMNAILESNKGQERTNKEMKRIVKDSKNLKDEVNKIINSEKKKLKVKDKKKFYNLVNRYKDINPPKHQDLKIKNNWVEWHTDIENSHTKLKCPAQGLHLVVHHYKNKENQQIYDKGYTILKDPRFLLDKDTHWPWRVDLIPVYDKKRGTRCYYVKKNEFGQREW